MFLPRAISLAGADRTQISAPHAQPFVSLLLTFADARLDKLIGDALKLRQRAGAVMEGVFGGGAESVKLSAKEPRRKIRAPVSTNEPRGTKRCTPALKAPRLTGRRKFHGCFKNTLVFLGSGPVSPPAEEAERRSASCRR